MLRAMRRSHLNSSWGRFAGQRGTALAELAIVLPLVMVLLLGMLDFGNAYNSWIDGTHLANEGVRLAAVNYKPPACTGAGIDTSGGLACYIQQNADLADAMLVYLAERDGIQGVFTIDRRDFSIYRYGKNRRLKIIPD